MIYCVIPQALADELYDKMVAYYKDDPNVTVIIDRREGPDRRRGETGPHDERGEYIGEATNNVAEYRALLLGLELARSVGAREVEVINDSELVARQIGGQYKVKHAGLKPLFLDALSALRSFDRWSVRNVPRAENTRADALVNQALD